ncbi:MAG: hypothetical protein H7Y36_02110 [Armatimonadetes bacterium]|nr:hypothetical protein [Akkermansiaceae bacterium]
MWPNLLCLDAPLIAVSWQCLFAACFKIQQPIAIQLMLGLGVWTIYLADRLYDAWRAIDIPNSTARLRFAKKHSPALVILLAAAASLDLVLIMLFASQRLIFSGLGIALLVAIYYLLRLGKSGNFLHRIPREVLCGMVFAFGSVFTIQSSADSTFKGATFYPATFLFGLVCSANCLLISSWEQDSDFANADPSIASTHRYLLPYLSSVTTLLSIVSLSLSFLTCRPVFLAIFLASFSLSLISRYEKRLSVTALRVLADAVFLSPLLVLPFV